MHSLNSIDWGKVAETTRLVLNAAATILPAFNPPLGAALAAVNGLLEVVLDPSTPHDITTPEEAEAVLAALAPRLVTVEARLDRIAAANLAHVAFLEVKLSRSA